MFYWKSFFHFDIQSVGMQNVSLVNEEHSTNSDVF